MEVKFALDHILFIWTVKWELHRSRTITIAMAP